MAEAVFVVPAGSIAEDIDSFLLSVRLSTPDDDAVVYNSDGEVLESEVRSYTNGILHLVIKTPLYREMDNVFTCRTATGFFSTESLNEYLEHDLDDYLALQI